MANREGEDEDRQGLTRREFVKAAAFTAAGAGAILGGIGSGIRGIVSGALGAELTGKSQMKYRRLGRTNLMISEIAGSGMPRLYQTAIDLGVNYWHKMGSACRDPQLFSKLDRDSFYCDATIDHFDRDQAIGQFTSCLRSSGLEYIDFFKIHSLYARPEWVKTKTGILEAFEYLKQQGKTKFLAVSQHSNIPEILTACIESGLFDAIQPPYNVMSQPQVAEVIALAKKHDVGIICMKTLAVGKNFTQDQRLRERVKSYLPDNGSIAQALLKYVLATPGVTAAVPLMRNHDQLIEDIGASGGKLTARERKGLEIFVSIMSADYCRMCGACEHACPRGVAIPDILRYSAYYAGYGEARRATQLYAQLEPERKASRCDSCGECEIACPYGLSVVTKLREAHQMLA